jgi:hypothetical protein
MVTEQEGGSAADTIRQMIDQRLKARTADDTAAVYGHLDEDAICAFVEGRLEEAEAAPVISHLIECASCRHTTTLLIRFESQFESEIEIDPTPIESPGRVRRLLERMAAGFTPSLEEDAVFAYQNPEPDPDDNAELTEQNPGERTDGK